MEIAEESYLPLLEESFPGINDCILRCKTLGFHWEASQLFLKEEEGKVVSHVALLECPIIIEGREYNVGWFHAVCTEKAHRGRGLASELIQEGLQSAKGRCDFTVLYTDIPPFYEPLGFHTVPEHRFRLAGPFPKGTKTLRPIVAPQDNELFLRCFSKRAPLSNRLWVDDHGLLASFYALYSYYPVYETIEYSPTLDGFICYTLKDKSFHLVDIVCKTMPSLEVILDHLPTEVDDVVFYFSPDLFTDSAVPEPFRYDNNNLMVHGQWPLTGPFMIPPLDRC